MTGGMSAGIKHISVSD